MKKRKHIRLRPANGMPSSARSIEARNKVLSVLKRARRGENLRDAIKTEHTTFRSFIKYAGSAVKQEVPNAAYVVLKSDKLVRRINFPVAKAPSYEEIDVSGIKAASFVAHYWIDRGKVLRNEASPKLLEKYEHRAIYDTHNKPHYFVTDLTTIKKLAKAGYRGPGDELYATKKS